MEPMNPELITKLLQDMRSRGSYVDALREWGIEVEPSKPLTRRQKLRINYEYYKDRWYRAWAILRHGSYPGENDW